MWLGFLESIMLKMLGLKMFKMLMNNKCAMQMLSWRVLMMLSWQLKNLITYKLMDVANSLKYGIVRSGINKRMKWQDLRKK